MIRRAKSRNPQAVVAACGCYVQTHTPEAQELGIDLIGGTGDRMEFLTLLEQAAEDHRSRVAVDEALRRRDLRGAARRGHGGPDPGHAEGGGRLRQLLHLLHHPLRPGAGAVPAAGGGGGARRSSCGGRATGRWSSPASRSPPGARTSRTAAASSTCWRRCPPAAGEMRLRLGSLEPRTVTEDFCRRAAAAAQPLPPVPPVHAVRLRRHPAAHEPPVRHRPVPAESVTLLRQYFHRPAITTDLITRLPRRRRRRSSPRRWTSSAPLRLCPDAHLPLLHPPRHQGGGDGAGTPAR